METVKACQEPESSYPNVQLNVKRASVAACSEYIITCVLYDKLLGRVAAL